MKNKFLILLFNLHSLSFLLIDRQAPGPIFMFLLHVKNVFKEFFEKFPFV